MEGQVSHEPESLNTDSVASSLPSLSQDGANEEIESENIAIKQINPPEPAAVVVERLPEPSPYQEEDSTWNEALNLERFETNSTCQEYQEIGREEEHGEVLKDHDCSIYLTNEFSTSFPPTINQAVRPASHGEGEISPVKVRKIHYGECLEWPVMQQEIPTFNDVSDVLLDSYRLNKETSFLLKMIDEQKSPEAVVLDKVTNSCTQTDTRREFASAKQINDFAVGLSSYPEANVSENSETVFEYNTEDTEINRNFELQENLEYIVNLDRTDEAGLRRNMRCHKTIYEVKEEKCVKRKEKNRECSRTFRNKQRLKEDAMKKGKLEKENYLRRLFHERERLRDAINELAKNCTSCPKAMQILCNSRLSNDKENIPTCGMGM